MGGDTAWEASYSDPLRFKPDGAAEMTTHAVPQVEEVRNENCTVKFVMMHRPTHDAKAEKSGEYPFSWHLGEKKRLWELRLQLRFSRPPQRGVFFGVELDRFVPVSSVVRQAQKGLVSTCQRIVGECYHTVGDNPASAQGELEAPAFVMPLWAFDQFHVAEPGQEPSLTDNLAGLGMSRAEDGVSKYISALKGVVESFSTEKVYTFCFWGISKFLDIIRWEVVGGIMPGIKLDFNRLCGAPPVYFTIYELSDDGQGKDKRHLASRKRQYFRCAAWSMLKPPVQGAPPPAPQDDVDLAGLMAAQGDGVDDLAGLDLLGLGGDEPQPAAAAAPAAAPVENVDLLGLL